MSINKEEVGLTEQNFLIFAAKHYENIFYDTLEFQEDLKRFAYIKRLFNHYQKLGELKDRLIINHLVIIFNMWPNGSIPMLFVKLKGHEILLKTFLTYMERMPNQVKGIGIDNRTINNSDIELDLDVLRKIGINE